MGCVWIVRLCYCGFELAGATLSPTRISHCPDQSPLSGTREGSVTCSPTPSLQEWKFVCVCAKAIFFFSFPFFFFFIKVSCFLYHDHVLGSVCVSSDLLSSALPSLSRCVGGFGYSEQLHRTCINTYYFHHPCVLKRLEIAFQCVVALGFPPAVFGIYSTCRATGTCTGNLCIISALLMLCLCRPLKSSTLWNKTPCFLSLPSLLTIPSFFYFLLPVSPYLLFSLIWFKKSLFNAALSSLFHL